MLLEKYGWGIQKCLFAYRTIKILDSRRFNWILEQPLLFTGCSSIQFFNLPPFPNTVSWTTIGSFLLTVQSLCELQYTMPHHWSPVLPTQLLPREAEDYI